ncbi:MAG: hypothetical protein A2V65_07090 [Deltaproteobacteria bacterium RBG_13_49_15]|nr:MAG: hypothetical protein A2V65_07090 [Deltaproteobacteria bacterium RBG_13_49_15]
MTGCHLDITPLKEVIQALEAEKGNFQVLVDASPLGIALAGKDERFRYLNPKFVELFGYNLNHIPSQQDWLVKAYPDPKYREEIIAMWKEAKRRDDPGVFRTRTFTVTCKDGTEKAVQIRAAFLADGDHVVTYEDISEQIHLENKLRQAQKMEAIATLAGGIAHDFNNILSAVIGYAELIRFDLPAGSKASQNLTQVLTAGLRAKELVKQILTFSRQADQDQIPIEPHLVVKEALKLLRSTLPTTIEIHQDLTPSGTILADPTQIHQVIMNLCTNAYHAMREKGGTLEVRMKPVALDSSLKKADSDLTAGKYVRLTVEDTGCGMPSEVANRIFDPYFTTKSEGEGTGLGLAVVNGIIKNHHGTITVSSEPGRGSVFTVYFPQIEHGAGAERESHEAPLPTGTEHILFVDDEPTLANLGKRMLEILGYRVEVCTSATDALDLFRKKPERFDLIITDMTMPAMTGSELAMALLQVRPNIPIILCTGFSYGMSEEKAKAIGIREFIFKPFVQKDMATAIRKALI